MRRLIIWISLPSLLNEMFHPFESIRSTPSGITKLTWWSGFALGTAVPYSVGNNREDPSSTLHHFIFTAVADFMTAVFFKQTPWPRLKRYLSDLQFCALVTTTISYTTAVKPRRKAAGRDSFLVTTFGPMDPVRSRTVAVHQFPTCYVCTMWPCWLLCCVLHTTARPGMGEEVQFQEAREQTTGICTPLASRAQWEGPMAVGLYFGLYRALSPSLGCYNNHRSESRCDGVQRVSARLNALLTEELDQWRLLPCISS